MKERARVSALDRRSEDAHPQIIPNHLMRGPLNEVGAFGGKGDAWDGNDGIRLHLPHDGSTSPAISLRRRRECGL